MSLLLSKREQRMIAEISSLVASSKTAYAIAKGLASAYTDAKVRKRTSELLAILLSVQNDALTVNAKHQELLQDKYNLEKKIMEFEQWSKIKDNYELKELAPGIPAYLRKKTDETKDPMMWICPYCYGQKKKSFLQRKFQSENGGLYFCPICRTKFEWGQSDTRVRRKYRLF
jgi:hypothetical protein